MSDDTLPTTRQTSPALRTLLYRYFFFAWLFKDTARGTLYERAAAWRHNVEQARWLPTYMRRYLVCGLVLVALGGMLEPLAPLLAVWFFVPGVVTVPMTAVVLVGWLWLRGGAG